MMRNKTVSSMQKTYDECYLICSTAVYFEGQGNEAEALRSWRSALDRIYYHNAYRMPQDYRPRTETDRALHESLRDMELQCRERVNLLTAVRDSRNGSGKEGTGASPAPSGSSAAAGTEPGATGNAPLPQVNYNDIARPPLPSWSAPPSRPPPSWSAPPPRPAPEPQGLSARGLDAPPLDTSRPLSPNPAPSTSRTSRSPSPEKKGRMKMTLRDGRTDKKKTKTKPKPPAASKAAGLAWDTKPRVPSPSLPGHSSEPSHAGRSTSYIDPRRDSDEGRRVSHEYGRRDAHRTTQISPTDPPSRLRPYEQATSSLQPSPKQGHARPVSPRASSFGSSGTKPPPVGNFPPPDSLRYRKEYPKPSPVSKASIAAAVIDPRGPGSTSPEEESSAQASTPKDQGLARRPVPKKHPKGLHSGQGASTTSETADDTSSSPEAGQRAATKKATRKKRSGHRDAATPESSDQEPEGSPNSENWEERLAYVKKHLPKGIDPGAAKQIFNEIVVQGDEVHWSDVAGLDAAKKALKEAVVYPFLRPDLFMGLREPARGMLLFGPPGTGKTMLARAVATESRATFFAISASSLTSKWLGDSEKLVRALFGLARALAPSIIFVDEIDSLLSSRGGSSEHESTRRIKTEFLIQWSDLQRAAAGKEVSENIGDASRVLVLAATNMPWAIDDAARRRFVRRQYIPLPERPVRAEQLEKLLSHQKHDLDQEDIEVLVRLTDGYSGSDITALAKDAAMGPLRSLGEALLSMSRDEIRPINFHDFEASLVNIRPSVNQQGLKEFEDWAREFGERGV